MVLPTERPPNSATGTIATAGQCVAGIDVGGEKKGFHLVVLRDNKIVCNARSRRAEELVEKCVELGVVAVSVDAPCKWRPPGQARLAERQLARKRISSFSTPTRERAEGHSFYGWMLNGEAMYAALSSRFTLTEGPGPQPGKVHFETFPHAVTCALLGTNVASARLQRPQRSELLRLHGVDTAVFKSIDAIDAAICALTAAYLLNGSVHWYGDQAGGYLVVPETPRTSR